MIHLYLVSKLIRSSSIFGLVAERSQVGEEFSRNVQALIFAVGWSRLSADRSYYEGPWDAFTAAPAPNHRSFDRASTARLLPALG
jgi:hypothetical protein